MKVKAGGLKEQALKLKEKALAFLKAAPRLAADYAMCVMLVGGLVYVAARAPEAHNYWMRAKVGTRVYKIKDSDRSGGGTGFAIRAPSGQSYILTNDHVCGVSSDGKTVQVSDDYGNKMRRNIIAHDDSSDLCLIEGLPGVDGLELGSAPSVGQQVEVVGHPSLMPITLTKGDINGLEDVYILKGPIAVQNPETGDWEQVEPDKGGITPEQCSLPKNEQKEITLQVFIFQIHVMVCAEVTKSAYVTNLQIRPGNSGSPVVNFWGNVVGVAFAGDSYMWGRVVNQQDIADFLKNF